MLKLRRKRNAIDRLVAKTELPYELAKLLISEDENKTAENVRLFMEWYSEKIQKPA